MKHEAGYVPVKWIGTGAFGKETEKGIPPVREIWFKYISIAVDMGTPNWDNTLSKRYNIKN